MTFETLTYRFRAKWWKIPFLWILGQPWKWEKVYHDVEIRSMRVSGGLGDLMEIHYDVFVPPQVEQVLISDNLRIPGDDEKL